MRDSHEKKANRERARRIPGPDPGSTEGLEARERIRAWGLELGLSRIGFARAEAPPESRRIFEWLERGLHAGMGWMARDPDSRIDPQKILPGARSVVAAALNYFGGEPVPRNPGAPRFSRYAWGDDYHEVLGEKLRALEARIRSVHPGVRSRVACDTSPVMDKSWGAMAGLGWQGKNTCLIDPEAGSWFFLGEIFLDLELPPDPLVLDHCGTCTRCIEICPSGALDEPYVLDARRCISYLTIEHRGPFPGDEVGAWIGDWLVGCDLCQDVCPWNRKAPISQEPRFGPRPGLSELPAGAWVEIADDDYRARVRGTAVTRIKPADMRRNARQVETNRASERNRANVKPEP